MTETVKTREDLEAELASLRARENAIEKVAPELSTRERSPIKPADHKPGDTDLVTVEFEGAEFKVKSGGLRKLVVLDKLERGMLNTAIRLLVGDEAYEAFLERNPDADDETAGKLLEAITEKAGAKNS